MQADSAERFESDGLFHVTHGAGRPLLALHGGLGLDHTTLRPSLDALGGAATVVFADLRGCGRSPGPDDPAGWEALDHAAWVADLDALREHLGYERWAVFGHSYGGVLALEYARRYPGRVDGLVLCATAPSMSHAESVLGAVLARATPEQAAALLDAFSTPRPSDEALEATWRTIAPLYLHRPTPERLAAVCDGIAFSAGAFNRTIFGCLPAFDAHPWLGDVDAPALVLSGRHDWLYPPEHGGEPLAEGLPDAEHVVFEESGHCPFVEEPDRFVRVVSDWLARLPEHPATDHR